MQIICPSRGAWTPWNQGRVSVGVSGTVSHCIISKYFVLYQIEIFFIFLEDELFTPLRGKAFIFDFQYCLKASLSPIYTVGMNLPIYSPRMAELQSLWHCSLDGTAVYIAQWWALCQGPADADLSFSCVNVGISLKSKVNRFVSTGTQILAYTITCQIFEQKAVRATYTFIKIMLGPGQNAKAWIAGIHVTHSLQHCPIH